MTELYHEKVTLPIFNINYHVIITTSIKEAIESLKKLKIDFLEDDIEESSSGVLMVPIELNKPFVMIINTAPEHREQSLIRTVSYKCSHLLEAMLLCLDMENAGIEAKARMLAELVANVSRVLSDSQAYYEEDPENFEDNDDFDKL